MVKIFPNISNLLSDVGLVKILPNLGCLFCPIESAFCLTEAFKFLWDLICQYFILEPEPLMFCSEIVLWYLPIWGSFLLSLWWDSVYLFFVVVVLFCFVLFCLKENEFNKGVIQKIIKCACMWLTLCDNYQKNVFFIVHRYSQIFY